MDISSSPFESPTPLVRPRGARLLQGFSPKLARAMQFTRRSVFEHWIRLEADPRVTSFCERPASAVVNGQPIAIDFWVQSDDDEELVLLMPGDRDPDLPEQVLGLPLAQIPLAEQTAHHDDQRGVLFNLQCLARRDLPSRDEPCRARSNRTPVLWSRRRNGTRNHL